MKYRKLLSLTVLGVLATGTAPAFVGARPSEQAELIRHDLDQARSYVVRAAAEALTPWSPDDAPKMEAQARKDLQHAEKALEIAEGAVAMRGSEVSAATLPASAVETAIEHTRALEAAPSAPGAQRKFEALRNEIWTLMDEL